MTVDRETSRKAVQDTALLILFNLGSSTSKKDEQIGDNKASVRGSVSMDENTEYSIISIHTGTAICIIIALLIMAAIYYLAFKVKCSHANSPHNTNNIEMIQREPRIEYQAPRYIEMPDEREKANKTRWISRDQLDSLFK